MGWRKLVCGFFSSLFSGFVLFISLLILKPQIWVSAAGRITEVAIIGLIEMKSDELHSDSQHVFLMGENIIPYFHFVGQLLFFSN